MISTEALTAIGTLQIPCNPAPSDCDSSTPATSPRAMSAPIQPTVEKTKEPTPAIADPQQPPQPTTQQPAQPQQAPKKRSRFDNKRYHPSDAVLIVAAILLPPLAVFLKTGCSGDSATLHRRAGADPTSA